MKKGCNFDTKLQPFFGASEGNRSCDSQSKKEKQYLLLCSLLRSVAKNDKSHLSFFPQNRSLPFDSPRKKIKKRQAKACRLMERVRGIEPPTNAWEALVLPLNYTRLFKKLNIYSFSTVTIDTIAL